MILGVLVSLADRVQSEDGHASFYGMKLCGREFIRAVIFTCGGSRWRRSLGDSGTVMCVRERIFEAKMLIVFLHV